MSYVIETDLGRFEAEDEKGAKRLLRKAQREYDARLAREKVDRELAYDRAGAEAYRVTFKDGFRARCDYRPRGVLCCPTATSTMNGDAVTVETEHGSGVLTLLGYRLVGALVSPAGWPLLLWTTDIDTPSKHEVYAIGVSNGLVALAELPVDQFPIPMCKEDAA